MCTAFTRLQNFCLETNHPYIQIFYFIIGPFFYLACCFLVLQPKIMVIGPSYLYLCHSFALLGFYNYVRAWLSNSGVINKSNEQSYIEKYKVFYDQITFRENNKCATCDIVKYRQKTCSFQTLQRLQQMCRPFRPSLPVVA